MIPARSRSAVYVTSVIVIIVGLLVAVGAMTGNIAFVGSGGSQGTLRIATTTSLDDSGLLSAILPEFEEQESIDTEVVAVGTGQALTLGERGDVDVVLVHVPGLEREFVEQGYGIERMTFMTNHFLIAGPEDDPAGISEATSAPDAFNRIAGAEATFVSRGDDSGTHTRELQIWAETEYEPSGDMGWYNAVGRGMGGTLLTADELGAYTLVDGATFVAMGDEVSALVALFEAGSDESGDDSMLINPYSVIAVNPERHEHTNIENARTFIAWLREDETRERIAGYGIDTYDQALFALVESR